MVKTQDDLVNYTLDSDLSHKTAPRLFTVTALRTPAEPRNRFSLTKASSLRSLNTLAKSIKSKFGNGKTTPNHHHSRSVECMLRVNERDNYCNFGDNAISLSDEEPENMASLRRVESERRSNVPSPRYIRCGSALYMTINQ